MPKSYHFPRNRYSEQHICRIACRLAATTGIGRTIIFGKRTHIVPSGGDAYTVHVVDAYMVRSFCGSLGVIGTKQAKEK